MNLRINSQLIILIVVSYDDESFFYNRNKEIFRNVNYKKLKKNWTTCSCLILFDFCSIPLQNINVHAYFLVSVARVRSSRKYFSFSLIIQRANISLKSNWWQRNVGSAAVCSHFACVFFFGSLSSLRHSGNGGKNHWAESAIKTIGYQILDIKFSANRHNTAGEVAW